MSVYIVGVPRSGKTTLARMIVSAKPEFNLISFEAIRNGFILAQPELDMGNRSSLAREEILPPFVFEFLRWNESMMGRGTIMEGAFAKIAVIKNKMCEGDVIVCLGFGGRELEVVADKVLTCAKEGDYIFGCPKQKFLQHFYDLEKTDQENMRFCRENEIEYYDTFEDREEVLRRAAKKIINSRFFL